MFCRPHSLTHSLSSLSCLLSQPLFLSFHSYAGLLDVQLSAFERLARDDGFVGRPLPGATGPGHLRGSPLLLPDPLEGKSVVH